MRSNSYGTLIASIPALILLGGCETVAEEATEAIGHEYIASLSGASGTGKVEISLNDATNTLCSDLELSPGVAMTAGHILGPGNDVIADLEVPRDPGGSGDNDSEDCDQITDSQLDAIRANPGAFRVHIAAAGGDLTGTLRKER